MVNSEVTLVDALDFGLYPMHLKTRTVLAAVLPNALPSVPIGLWRRVGPAIQPTSRMRGTLNQWYPNIPGAAAGGGGGNAAGATLKIPQNTFLYGINLPAGSPPLRDFELDCGRMLFKMFEECN